MRSYRGLKEARRSLRAAGLRAPSGKLTADQVAAFRTQMEALNTVQLSLEDCVRMIEARPNLLDYADRLVPKVEQLDKYVGTMIADWEETGKQLTTGVDARVVGELDALQHFLASASPEGDFKEKASTPVRHLIGQILALRRTPPKRHGVASDAARDSP